jgi:hypothetical protein
MLGAGQLVGVLLAFYYWGHRGFEFGELLITIGFVTLALVVGPALITSLERGRQRRCMRRRLRRAGPDRAEVLSDLYGLRSELAEATPVRGELLEQLADLLEQADALGGLAAQDRNRFVARLRAGAARGSTLGSQERERLVFDVRSCEALIAKGGCHGFA